MQELNVFPNISKEIDLCYKNNTFYSNITTQKI